MKKGIAMFMALTVAAGLLVGCGSNSNSGSGEGSNSSSTAAEAASTPEANTEAKSESKGTNSTAAAEGPINVDPVRTVPVQEALLSSCLGLKRRMMRARK